jgi:hypothetical protein
LERHLDKSWIAAMETAQKVYSIGKVATRMTAGSFKKEVEIGMSSTALCRDARELGFGNAGLDMADGPIQRHSFPPVLAAPSLNEIVLTQGRKDEVYAKVSFPEPCSAVQSSR